MCVYRVNYVEWIHYYFTRSSYKPYWRMSMVILFKNNYRINKMNTNLQHPPKHRALHVSCQRTYNIAAVLRTKYLQGHKINHESTCSSWGHKVRRETYIFIWDLKSAPGKIFKFLLSLWERLPLAEEKELPISTESRLTRQVHQQQWKGS